MESVVSAPSANNHAKLAQNHQQNAQHVWRDTHFSFPPINAWSNVQRGIIAIPLPASAIFVPLSVPHVSALPLTVSAAPRVTNYIPLR